MCAVICFSKLESIYSDAVETHAPASIVAFLRALTQYKGGEFERRNEFPGATREHQQIQTALFLSCNAAAVHEGAHVRNSAIRRGPYRRFNAVGTGGDDERLRRRLMEQSESDPPSFSDGGRPFDVKQVPVPGSSEESPWRQSTQRCFGGIRHW